MTDGKDRATRDRRGSSVFETQHSWMLKKHVQCRRARIFLARDGTTRVSSSAYNVTVLMGAPAVQRLVCVATLRGNIQYSCGALWFAQRGLHRRRNATWSPRKEGENKPSSCTATTRRAASCWRSDAKGGTKILKRRTQTVLVSVASQESWSMRVNASSLFLKF